MAGADAPDGFPHLQHVIWPRNERDVMVAKSASFGHDSLVCGLWLVGGGLGRSVPTYVLGTFYIRFFLYLGYGIPVLGEDHCTRLTRVLQQGV